MYTEEGVVLFTGFYFMNKMKMLVVYLSICLFGGCASQMKQIENEALLPEIDVVQVKENSDQALKLAQEIKLDVEALSSKITDNDNRLSTLSDDVSSVSAAKIEEIENRMGLVIEAIKDLQVQVKTLETMSLRVKTPQSQPDPTFSPASASIASPETDIYNTGLRAFNSRNYQEAVKIFSDVLTKYPSGSYADNAHFWIGECYFSLGDFASAIKSYERVASFKETSKGDDALYKIGVTYLKMGQQALAKQELEKMLTRYPGSEYAERAKKALSEIR